ncbi:MAG: sigma 54-interacting transcriptional regulator [Candidatus Zixiibacteriota bacterium]
MTLGNLLDAELFGAKRGVCAGCVENRKGKFQDADGAIHSYKRNNRSPGDAPPPST